MNSLTGVICMLWSSRVELQAQYLQYYSVSKSSSAYESPPFHPGWAFVSKGVRGVAIGSDRIGVMTPRIGVVNPLLVVTSTVYIWIRLNSQAKRSMFAQELEPRTWSGPA